MRRALITGAVVVLSTVLATLATNAIDFRADFARSLLGLIFSHTDRSAPCDEDMVLVVREEGSFCIDRFEASPAPSCPFSIPANVRETAVNLASDGCVSASRPGVVPWRSITRDQAEAACARSGKRLPDAGEWYRAALGTQDLGSASGAHDCNIAKSRESGIVPTGETSCVSAVGAYDMIGNAWEWTGDTIDTGLYRGRALPETGHVTEIDTQDGMPTATATTASAAYGHDHAYLDADEVVYLMRGGSFGGGTDSGLYALYTAKVEFAGQAGGFRCVKETKQNF